MILYSEGRGDFSRPSKGRLKPPLPLFGRNFFCLEFGKLNIGAYLGFGAWNLVLNLLCP